MRPEENILYPFSGGFFEVADEWEYELMVEESEVDGCSGLQEDWQVAEADGLKPLNQRVVHDKHWLELYGLAVMLVGEPEKCGQVNDRQRERNPHHAEPGHALQHLPQVGHHEISVVEHYHEDAAADAGYLSWVIKGLPVEL